MYHFNIRENFHTVSSRNLLEYQRELFIIFVVARQLSPSPSSSVWTVTSPGENNDDYLDMLLRLSRNKLEHGYCYTISSFLVSYSWLVHTAYIYTISHSSDEKEKIKELQ